MNFAVGCTYVDDGMAVGVCGSLRSRKACRVSSVAVGELQAYDQHLNMILGDVEETVTTVEIDEETYEELYKVNSASPLDLTLLSPRGDRFSHLVCLCFSQQRGTSPCCLSEETAWSS